MSAHELILLSPYRYPGANALTLAPEDMACWLNGHSVLWHPALLWQAKEPPRVESTYDHETPKPGCVYVVPEMPPTYLPDDWRERVRAAGSLAITAGPERATTLDNLKQALSAEDAPALGWKAGADLPAAKAGPFFGIGLGHLLQATLAEAMEHENLLDASAFWDKIQEAVASVAGLPFTPSVPSTPHDDAPYNPEEYVPTGEPPEEHLAGELARRDDAAHDDSAPLPDETSPRGPEAQRLNEGVVPDPDAWRTCLETAAMKLLSAREVLYPVNINLLDLTVIDDKALDVPWPDGINLGIPSNVVASARTLEKLAEHFPDKFAQLREGVRNDRVEICGGSYIEREDPYLPIDSQLWNLGRGLEATREIIGAEVRVFARKRFGFHPQLPLWLTTNGLTKALFLVWDDSAGLPSYTSLVVSFPSPDGKQLDAFVRAPKPADSAETFFNLGHSWYKTTREDHSATIFLAHQGKPPAPWYSDLMELARLGTVLGQWTTFSRYFTDVMAGEYPTPAGPDEFHSDFLSERVNQQLDGPVSAFPRHARQRRRLDACWTFAALHRALSASNDALRVEPQLRELENAIEISPGVSAPGLDAIEQTITRALADRLQSRAVANQPGYLLLNPCSFARRAALELEGARHPLPIDGPVKACQLDGNKLRVVAEVPALGFAWIPREGQPNTPPMTARLRLGEQKSLTIRNEFFEAEVDAATGAMKAIRDHKTRMNRLGQRLVFNPGSYMVASKVEVTSSGPALGEIISQGQLLGEQDQVLAKFRQRLRAWLGRPLLEIHIELEPVQPPAGYPWHAYFGCRFAWRDERQALLRGINGAGYLTNHPRPQTGDFLDLRFGNSSTTIFPGGLPFHQRHEGRMLDVILIPEGETATSFDLGIGLDRELPILTTLGMLSPIAVVPTDKGPPHIGSSGWLFHLDAANLLLTRMTPGVLERPREDFDTVTTPKPEPRDAVTARLLETSNSSGHAELRCVRDPSRAVVLDAQGGFLLEATRSGDAVFLEVSPNDLVHVQVEFS